MATTAVLMDRTFHDGVQCLELDREDPQGAVDLRRGVVARKTCTTPCRQCTLKQALDVFGYVFVTVCCLVATLGFIVPVLVDAARGLVSHGSDGPTEAPAETTWATTRAPAGHLGELASARSL